MAVQGEEGYVMAICRLIEALPDAATGPAQRFLQWVLDEEAEVDLFALTAEDWDAVRQGEVGSR